MDLCASIKATISLFLLGEGGEDFLLKVPPGLRVGSEGTGGGAGIGGLAGACFS